MRNRGKWKAGRKKERKINSRFTIWRQLMERKQRLWSSPWAGREVSVLLVQRDRKRIAGNLKFPISHFCLPMILLILNWPLGFPGDSVAKSLPAIQETQVWSLGWKDPLEKEMTTHSSILALKKTKNKKQNLWTEKPDELQSMESQRVRHNLATKQQ